MRVNNGLASIVISLCLGLLSFDNAQAAIGHTVGNGGGGAELILTDLLSTLSRKLENCLHSTNPCALESRQRQAAARIHETYKTGVATDYFEKVVRYDNEERALSRKQILANLLREVHAENCIEGLQVSSLDWVRFAERIDDLKYFWVSTDETVFIHTLSADSSVLRFKSPTAEIDLLAKVKSYLKASPELNAQVSQLAVRRKGKGYEVQGRIKGPLLDAQFLIWLEDVTTADVTRIFILEGGYGISQR